METEDTYKTLEANRDLLDPEFEGYRLSLDDIPGYEVELWRELRVKPIDKSMYSKEHIKLYASVNSLITDRWNPNMLYFVDKDFGTWSVIEDEEESGIKWPKHTHYNPVQWEDMHCNDIIDHSVYQPSMTFPNESLAILTDGLGYMMMLDTGDRREQKKWKMHAWYRGQRNFVLLDSAMLRHEKEDGRPLVMYMASFVDDDLRNGRFYTTIALYKYFINEKGVPDMARSPTLVVTANHVDFGTMDGDGNYYVACNDARFNLTYSPGLDRSDLPYTWDQMGDEVTITFAIDQGLTKKDIEVEFHKQSLAVKIRGEEMFRDKLYTPVSPEVCTWTLMKKKTNANPEDKSKDTERLFLELMVVKVNENHWWRWCFEKSRKGEQILSTDSAPLVQDHLSTLDADTMKITQPERTPADIMNELEACDYASDDQPRYLCQFKYDANTPHANVKLDGYKWLYNTPAYGNSPRSFCLGRDTDGLLFSPTQDTDTPFKHETTFNALGYVQASKQKRRFMCSPPDHSYVAIAEVEQHIYIYKKPETIATDLRNRKTGQSVKSTATMQVIKLPRNDTIHGVTALNKSLYVITRRHLYKYRIFERLDRTKPETMEYTSD